MIVPFYFPFNLIMNEPFFQPRNNSFAPRTARNAPSFSSIISCIGGGRIRACSGQAALHAIHKIQLSFSVITCPSSILIASVGQAMAHLPHFVQEGADIGVAGISISSL